MEDDEEAWDHLCALWQRVPHNQTASPTNASPVGSCSMFKSAHIADATKQIRPLRFLPSIDGIACLLEVFDQNGCPPYANFSYTWGVSDEKRTIIVNEKPFQVGANCHHALEQASALRHASLGHFWIDSICVNQADMKERSEQVTIMGSIYRNASIVLVCLGAHSDDSAFFFDTLLKSEWGNLGGRNTKASAQARLVEQELTQFGAMPHGVQRFLDALNAFGRREYWKRLWIIQEITLARNVLLLCGDYHIDLRRFITAIHSVRHCGSRSHSARPLNRLILPRHIAHALQQALPYSRNEPIDRSDTVQQLSLFEAMQKFGTCRCKDLRDRIYGLRSILRWPSTIPEPVTDYNISIIDLALQLLPILREDGQKSVSAQALQELITALELTPAQVKDLVAADEVRSSTSASGNLSRETFLLSGRACRLMSGSDGGLTADLHFNSGTRSLHNSWKDLTSPSMESPAVPIWIGDTLAAIGSPQARSGDILFRAYPFWLIVRDTEDTATFEIVGQAWMGPAQLCPNDGKKCKCIDDTGLPPPLYRHRYANMTATMSFEDLCVLEAFRRRAGKWQPDVDDDSHRGAEYLLAQPTKTRLSSYAVLDEKCGLEFDRISGNFIVTRS